MSTTWLWLLGAAVILYLVSVAVSELSDTLATITERPLATAFLALVVSAIVVLVLTIHFFKYDKDFFENIMVEAHGMLLDILVIGLFILWLNKRGERRLENKRYQEEIDDFRHWHSEEALYRIVGNIKRLNRNGVSEIDLSSCHLTQVILTGACLQGADLTEANLEGADLTGANLQGTRLWRTNFAGADLLARLAGADLAMIYSENLTEEQIQSALIAWPGLAGANLAGANLARADLRGANLGGANLADADLWGANLQGSKNLTEAQIQSAQINEDTILPDYLKRPT